MGFNVASLVYRKKIGSAFRKSILSYCAWRANDDGSGIWASKTRIAKELECSRQTVVDTMQNFVKEGILIDCGKMKTARGYVVIYQINLRAVAKLENALEDHEIYASPGEVSNSGHVNRVDSTCQPGGQHMSAPLTAHVSPVDTNNPLTTPEQSSNSQGDGSGEPDLFSGENAENDEGQPDPAPQQDPEVDHAEEFWTAYPQTKRKVGRAKVKALFDRIVAGKVKGLGKVDPERIVRAVKAYAAENPDPDFICAPTRWLNEERWENYPDRPEGNGPVSMYHPGTRIPIWENLA